MDRTGKTGNRRGRELRQQTGRQPRQRVVGRSGERTRESNRLGRSQPRQLRGSLPSRARRPGVEAYQRGAKARLQRFRQGSLLAVSLTALLLLLWGVDPEAAAQEETSALEIEGEQELADQDVPLEDVGDPAQAVSQAVDTIWELLLGFYGLFPKLLIAAVLIAVAALASRLARWLLHKLLVRWERTEAIVALAQIAIYLIAIAVALSIIAGDARALVGSIGLVGLALSWALQTPIESFTGWLLNSFQGYYRVGDRIEVGEVFGDVYRIDILTTTVWEAGGPGKAVAGAQPTGAMITFPNWEVLRSNLVNYSRDFPFVWDEVVVSVANESDLAYTRTVLQAVAMRVVGQQMHGPVAQYQQLLARARLAFDIAEEPQVFVSAPDASWTDCTVRYLVDARQRRRWATELHIALSVETAKPEHQGKIIAVYPRTEVVLRRDWAPESLAPAPPRES